MECTDHHKYSNKRFYALQTGKDALWESKNKKTLDFCIRCKNEKKEYWSSSQVINNSEYQIIAVHKDFLNKWLSYMMKSIL